MLDNWDLTLRKWPKEKGRLWTQEGALGVQELHNGGAIILVHPKNVDILLSKQLDRVRCDIENLSSGLLAPRPLGGQGGRDGTFYSELYFALFRLNF